MRATSTALSSDADLFVPFDRAGIEQSISARFEETVAAFPDRLAVKGNALNVTYAALNEQANQMAWAILEAQGQGPAPVVLLLDQGSTQVVAVLGSLKAGKFYVPLNPLHPRAHLAEILAQVRGCLIITEARYQALATQLADASQQVLRSDRLRHDLPVENPGLLLGPDSLAYIYFTSGSTGRPKGVVDSHRNVLHNVMRYTNSLRIVQADRLSLIQAPSFSGTVSSLFGALLNGAVLCPYNLRQEGLDRLGEWVNETEITIYHSVPMFFRHLCREGFSFPHVRLIRLEGDRALRSDAALYQQCFSPHCQLVNGLGITETGLCRQYFLSTESALPDPILPVGYPVPDMEVLVLDEDGQSVAAGEAGEIAVRSQYLSLGYWQQPDLTKALFMHAVDDEKVRIYRTGDRGRLRCDNCLEYLGRNDGLLKVRGQRVEPAEVERVLLQLPGMREAAVTISEDEHGEARVLAYLVCPASNRPTSTEMRQLLRARLPEALIPAAHTFLDSLPVTSEGKVDRFRLSEPENTTPVSAYPFNAPQTLVERTLAEVWAEVLDLDRVGRLDDFLSLGGDSIKAMQVLSRIQDRLQTDLHFSILLQYPRLVDLAAQIERAICKTMFRKPG